VVLLPVTPLASSSPPPLHLLSVLRVTAGTGGGVDADALSSHASHAALLTRQTWWQTTDMLLSAVPVL
jgi:hypothetical protein